MGRGAALPGALEGLVHPRPESAPTRPATSPAGREDLQRVAAELSRRFQRIQVASRNGSMNPNPHTPIHPRWRLRFRLWFRAVFVFGVEFCDWNEGLSRHAC